jgi:glutamine cyclotransferase
VTIATPPPAPGIEQDRDLEQRVADLEALIEEARRRARRRRTRHGVGALLLVSAGVVAFVGFGGHGGGGAGNAAVAHSSGAQGSTAPESPTAGTVVASIHVPGDPLGLVVTPGAVWATALRSTFAYRIDSDTNKVAAKIQVGGVTAGQPARMVSTGGRVIEVNYSWKTVAFIDPKSNTAKIVSVRFENCCWPVVAGGSLWVLGFSSSVSNVDRLSRIDPKTGRVTATQTLVDAQGLVYGAGSLWASSSDRIIRLDPRSGKTISRLSVHGQPFAFGDGSIWALENDTINNVGHVLRIDPATGSVVANIVLPYLAGNVAAAPNGTIWVSENSGAPHPLLWTIDPTTDALAGQVDLGNVTSEIDDLAVAPDGTVWVTLFDANLVIRVQPN